MADSLAGPKWFNLAKEQSANHMAKTVWFIAGVTRGIGTEITKAALVDSNQVVASDRKPEVVTKALGTYL
jgi:NADP-dependent 3-hydroxy acid dehydrogenase YdfG